MKIKILAAMLLAGRLLSAQTAASLRSRPPPPPCRVCARDGFVTFQYAVPLPLSQAARLDTSLRMVVPGDIHSTDLALRASLRTGALEWFAHGDLLNLFNNDGVADPQRLGTTVGTAATSPAFPPFDPRTETCTAMGAHYQLAPNFGQPLNDLAYQRPRTVRVSLGVRL